MSRGPVQFLTPFALAGGLSLASIPAHATFVIDTSCGVSSCAAGEFFFNDTDEHDTTGFTGTVGGHLVGPVVTVTPNAGVDTNNGAGFADIKPSGSNILDSLIFTPADDMLFSDFSFRGQLERIGFTGTVDVSWTDSSGSTGSFTFSGVKGPNADFDRIGIVSTDGETLKSVTISTPGSESFKEVKQVEFSAVPEPPTWALMLLGLAGLGWAAFNKTKRPRREGAIA